LSPPDAKSTPRTHGDILTAISDGIVASLKGVLRPGPHAHEVLLTPACRAGRASCWLPAGGRAPRERPTWSWSARSP